MQAEDARAPPPLDEQIDRIIQEKPELREYIQNLERDFTAAEGPSRPVPKPAMPLEPGEKIIRIDPFLRKDHDPRR